ncbi:MAG: DUF4465 domain-containing protein [Prevotella sp.]|nr:DUF4465 domain-containing protein [Prevotella sp.]
MKTKSFMTVAVLMGSMTLGMVSCTNEDNPYPAPTFVISFEKQQLNADGFWIGDAKGNSYSYDDDWGGKTTVYTDNAYTENGVTFPVTYNLYESAYGSSDFWSGFAISNRTATTFDPMTLTPDQYNNITGKAFAGNNFCVITTYGEVIKFETGLSIKGFYYTNSAYAVNSIVNGDYYAGAKFDATDWFKCTVVGYKADGTKATVDIDLAKDGDYVKTWQWADLSSLGEITALEFQFTGSRNNYYGVLTPAYICIDDVTVEKK